MSINATAAIGREFLACIARGDLERARTLIRPDARVWTPMAGDISGTQLIEMLTEAMEVFADGLPTEILGETAQGERVAFEARTRAPLKDGRVYENRYCFQFVVRDGLIDYMAEYTDTAPTRALMS